MSGLLDQFGNPMPRARVRDRRAASLSYIDGAESNRTNSERYAMAGTESPINDKLAADLATVRTRLRHMMLQSDILETMTTTLARDVAAADGPLLNIPNAGDYGRRVESLWRDYTDEVDHCGQMGLVDKVELMVRGLCLDGEGLEQLTTVPTDGRLPSVRLKSIAPRRLGDDLFSIDENVSMGVERRDGRPVAYHIFDEAPGLYGAMALRAKKYPARDIVHLYEVREADQARGVPWLATALTTIGELREYDQYTMDAAKLAAAMGVMLTPNEMLDVDEAKPATNEDLYEIARQSIKRIPVGYEATSFQSNHPHNQYKEFRDARLRGATGPLGMPLMVLHRDASGHNYSSARFDDQGYRLGIESIRKWIGRRVLDRLFREFLRESELMGLVGQRPAGLRWRWLWRGRRHVDRAKEAQGRAKDLENGTTTLTREVAADGYDFEEHLEELQREVDAFEARGLVHPLKAKGLNATGADEPPAEDDEAQEAGEENDTEAADDAADMGEAANA